MGSLVLLVAAVVIYGAARWKSGTSKLRERLEATRLDFPVKVYNPQELDRLPASVQRYFRAVLSDGQPLVTAVSVGHSGTFDLGESGERWKPFRSSQRVVTRRPGFDWDARVKMVPGLTA